MFDLHPTKVRSEPAIYLRECFVLFAANFIRWATHWLADQSQPAKNALHVSKLGVKRQVQVAAHISAQVIRNSEGKLLRFSEQSAFAGQVLKVGHNPKSCLLKEIKLKFYAAFYRIASDCTTVTLTCLSNENFPIFPFHPDVETCPI